MSALTQLLQKIKLDTSEHLFKIEDNNWRDKVPYRLQKSLEEEIKPDAFLVQENKPIAFFFDFTKERRVKDEDLFKEIWNLGGVPIIFIIKPGITEIYNGFSFDTETFALESLKIDGKEAKVEDISLWDIFSGKFWEKLPPPRNQVDEKLLENIKAAKEALVNKGLKDVYANNIIGRLLFSRYLIDRGVKIDEKYFTGEKYFLNILETKNKKLLYEYFNYLKETFNGDLFPVTKGEKQKVNENHLEILFHLFNGDEISTGQLSLFKTYNFKIIPVELISEVYERFISKTKQRKEGAYYTPSFLVDYILEKTVKQHLKNHNSCRVFDPSCGSGIFLVETLRHVIEKNTKNGKIPRKRLIEIVENNIFGVDKDETAINLSIFSLCLTLLDYIEPKDITKFRLPYLKDKNLFVADSFDTTHNFNNKIKDLDFILGNPPWGSTKKDNTHVRYSCDENIPISDYQIAQSFVVRVKDFSSKKTKCALVLTSKILYNHKADKFRKYWLENFAVDKILELSPVRGELFSGAVAPTAIVFYQYAKGKETKNQVITHTSVKPNTFLKYLKILVIEKNDIKEIKQKYFQKHDWLWKVMLYGNVFDFYFIKRLKEDYKTLNKIIEDYNLAFGQGFIKGKNGKYDSSHLIGKTYLDTRKKSLSKFYINDIILEKYEHRSKLYRKGKKGIFNTPYVLLKKGFSRKDFSFVSAYSEKDYVFTNSITAINGREEDKNILKNITGVLNSILSNYYFLMQGSSAGVEREQGHNKDDRFMVPIKIDDRISNKVDNLQDLHKKGKNKEIKKLEDELNEFILSAFEVNEFEKRLIDYATQISIPMLSNDDLPFKETTTAQFKSYAQIFMDHFGSRWNGNPDYFEIDIYFNKFIAGMNFKIVKDKRDDKIKITDDSIQTEKLFFKLIKLGEEKITDKFYQQRDIRGFNETSFYVVKPNQYKNWHPAIAQVDLHEFVGAMLKSGMDKI